jgi:hypothetical protein
MRTYTLTYSEEIEAAVNAVAAIEHHGVCYPLTRLAFYEPSSLNHGPSAMKKLLPEFEHHAQPVIPAERFMVRLAHSGAIAFALIIVSLLVGMAGYRWLEGLAWIDTFLNAAMLLGGMGPIHTPVTEGGKLFAGLYALYCGLAVILVAGVILAPIAHRILHRFHMESRER